MADYRPYFAQASMSGNGIFGLVELVFFVVVVVAVVLGLGLFKGNKGWKITWFGCACLFHCSFSRWPRSG
jgi:hypothetical protein